MRSFLCLFFLFCLSQYWIGTSGVFRDIRGGINHSKDFVRLTVTASPFSNTNNGNNKMTIVANDFNVSKDGSGSFKTRASRNLLGLWGVVQVTSILLNAIKRLFPIAIRPFFQKDFQPHDWLLYGFFCLFMAYSEGYRGFHLKFSPMVVERAFSIYKVPSFLNYLLAGPFSMGMFGASRKRLIVSWSLTAGIFSLVKIVKYLPYPYRAIVDAGVVTGLGLGTLSILYHTIRALFGVNDDNKDDKSKEL